MRLRFRLLSLLPLVLAPAASAGGPTAAPQFRVEKTTLPNGLEVVLHQDRTAPTVAVNIWYHVASKDDPPGKSGFAHLFEHVMFQGSKHVPEDTFFKFLERIGATGINGTTSEDRTNYFETVPRNQLELALWLESDRMGFLLDHADEATFKSQREVVKNERRQSYENAPYGMVYPFMAHEFYPAGHPYRETTIGSPEDLDRATLPDVQRFFKDWYRPNNATLVIAGDFEAGKALALVKKYFGPIPSAPLPARRAAPPVSLTSQQQLVVDAGVDVAQVRIWWPTPKILTPEDADLDLVGRILASGKTSRLYEDLVDGRQIAQSVHASQVSDGLCSKFEISATAQPGHSAEELLAEIDHVLEWMRNGFPKDGSGWVPLGSPVRSRIQEDELGRARTVFLADFAFHSERVASRADTLNMYNFHAGNAEFFAQDFARYRDASLARVDKTFRAYLPTDRRLVAFVHPVKGAPVSGVLHVEGGRP